MTTLWLMGFIRLELTANSRFYHLCNSLGICLYNIKCLPDNRISFLITINDLNKFKEVIKKTHIKFVVKQKSGFPFLLKKISYKYIYISAIIMFFIIVNFSLGYISDIKIYGNRNITSDEIINYLNDNNIRIFSKVKDVSVTELEKKIYNNFPQISFVSVSLTGNKIKITINEREIEKDKVDEYPSSIVSDREGIVYGIVARSGTKAVNVGQYVYPGDTLIDGKVETYDEYGGIISTEYRYADGDIYIYSSLDYSDVLQREYETKNYTGSFDNEIHCQMGKINLKLPYFYKKGENCDSTSTEITPQILKNLFPNFGIYKIVNKKYNIDVLEYSDEELEKILYENFYEYLKKIEEKGIQIIDKNVKMNLYANEGQLYGFVYIIEKIETRKAISDEYNRENN